MEDDLSELDATAQAELVRSGQASPAELVEAAIGRIEALDGELNAVVIRRFEPARAEAASPGLAQGLFGGVPFLLKDLGAPMAGEETHHGLGLLRRAAWRAPEGSYVADAVRRAGLVVVGRTNVPELGTMPTTEPQAYGPSHNPWALDRTTGGSSGGSAAAVAAGLVPAAHGSDGGGSIRIPASACGLVGLKPARGRVSAGPGAGEGWAGFSTQGALTRTVRDAAGLLDVLAERHPDDPYLAAAPERPFAREVGASPGRLRVGLSVDAPEGTEVHPECRAAVEVAGRLLESLGHEVGWEGPPGLADPSFLGHFVNLIAAAVGADLDRWGELLGQPVAQGDVEPLNWFYHQAGHDLTAAAYYASREWLHGYARRMVSWWTLGGWDVLVTPTLGTPPPPLGWLVDPDLGSARVPQFIPFTAQFNASGQPAVSLPLHWTPEGLPVGVQLVGPPAGEALLLRLAGQLEEAAPWAGRRPPTHA